MYHCRGDCYGWVYTLTMINITRCVFSCFILSLCLRGQDFDFGDKLEVSYSPYLRFLQWYNVMYLHLSVLSYNIVFFARRKLFSPIVPPALIGENTNFLSYVKHCIEDMATFTALAKFFPQIFLQYKDIHVAGLGEIFIQQNF